MKLVLFKDAQQVGTAAALHIVSEINKTARPDRHFVLGLITGSTPIATYQQLEKLHREGKVSFRDVDFFMMDEYCGLPREHPESYYNFLHENLLSKIDADPKNVHTLNGQNPDYVAECANYESALKKVGGVDLFLGGIGPNGHIAFNEPLSSIGGRTRRVKLSEKTRVANSRFFDGDLSKVPTHALSIGLGTYFESRKLLLLSTGASKAEITNQVVNGPVTQRVPASFVQLQPHAVMFVDEAAASAFSPLDLENARAASEANAETLSL